MDGKEFYEKIDFMRMFDYEPIDPDSITGDECGKCFTCLSKFKPVGALFPVTAMFMVVCQECGNKRCPKSTWHENECTTSNEPGQAGSRYA